MTGLTIRVASGRFSTSFLGLATHDGSKTCNDIGPKDVCSEDIEKIYDFRLEPIDDHEEDDNEVEWNWENDEMVVNVTVQCIGSARVTSTDRIEVIDGDEGDDNDVAGTWRMMRLKKGNHWR